MPKVLVSDEVCTATKKLAIRSFKETAVRVAPGWNEVPIEDDTLQMLEEYRKPNETDDQAFRRLLGLPPAKMQ